MTNTYREWDEEWLAPDGKTIQLHRIDIALNFGTGFIFERPTAEGKTRRVIFPAWTPAQILEDGYDVNSTDADAVVFAAMADIYTVGQSHGFDNMGPGNVSHMVSITAKMPAKGETEPTNHYMIGCSDSPMTMANAILFAPALLVAAKA